MSETIHVEQSRWGELQAWWPAAAIAGLVALLFLRVLRWLLNTWMSDPFFTHGFLVPVLVVGMVYWLWPRIRALPREQESLGVLGIALAFNLLVIARLRDDLFLESLSMLTLIGSLVLTTQGFARTRQVAAPLALLLFAIPYPFLSYVGPWLQAVSANGATALVGAFGIPTTQDVFTITAAGQSFEVAPLCSGLSSVISLTFVAFVAAYMARASPAWQGVLTLAAIPLAMGANLVRITATILIGVHYGAAAATGFFHEASDVVLYLIALAPILGAIIYLRRRQPHG